LDPSNVTKQYRALLQRAGLEQRRFHDLRHSGGTFLASRNVHPRVIMEVLGHSQVSTTMNIYTHVALDSMWEALDAISDIFDGVGAPADALAAGLAAQHEIESGPTWPLSPMPLCSREEWW
jgi:hypothetical protein